MDASAVSQSPTPPTVDFARIRILYSPTHSSRYKWGNLSALPPRLAKISRMLEKLARKHREFPGLAVPLDRLSDKIANEIGETRGAADDYVRALENGGILIEVELADGDKAVLYDAEQMDRATAFQNGGPTMSEPPLGQVQARVIELIKQALEYRDAGPSSGEQTLPNGNGSVFESHDLDTVDVVLLLEEAKQTIPLADGAGALEDVVVNPLGILQSKHPECQTDRLQAMLTRAVMSGYLVSIGKDVYRITLSPESGVKAKAMVAEGGLQPDVDRALEDELIQLRIALRQAESALTEEQQRLDTERGAKFVELNRRHERDVRTLCDEVRCQAEEALQRRRQEIQEKAADRKAVKRQELEEFEKTVDAEADAELHRTAEELQADAETQILRLQEEGGQSWEATAERVVREMQERREQGLIPFQSRVEELRELIALSEKFQARRKKPIS